MNTTLGGRGVDLNVRGTNVNYDLPRNLYNGMEDHLR